MIKSEKALARSRTAIEHRPFEMPPESLSSPKLTQRKLATEGRCRLCGVEFGPRTLPITRHHLIPESWFLGQPEELRLVRNAHANIVPLCRPCHDKVDSKHPLVREGARLVLRTTLTQQEVAFIIAVRGRAWLDSEYPLDTQ